MGTLKFLWVKPVNTHVPTTPLPSIQYLRPVVSNLSYPTDRCKRKKKKNLNRYPVFIIM